MMTLRYSHPHYQTRYIMQQFLQLQTPFGVSGSLLGPSASPVEPGGPEPGGPSPPSCVPGSVGPVPSPCVPEPDVPSPAAPPELRGAFLFGLGEYGWGYGSFLILPTLGGVSLGGPLGCGESGFDASELITSSPVYCAPSSSRHWSPPSWYVPFGCWEKKRK